MSTRSDLQDALTPEHQGKSQSKLPRGNPAANGFDRSNSELLKPNSISVPQQATSPINVPSPRTPSHAQAPTRIQPSRAAKRKAVEPTPAPKRPPARRKKAQAPAPIELETGKPTSSSLHLETETEIETRGDYTLAAHDWAQFLNGNQGEHRPSPWSYVSPQGLDVAYFCMRMERAVGAKIEEILLAARQHNPDQSITVSSPAEEETDEAAQDPKAKSNPQAAIPPNLRCALTNHHHHHPEPTPFTPAAALAPGEDWRPPTSNPNPHPNISPTRLTPGSGGNIIIPDATTITPNTSNSITTTSWAADEVQRREEINNRAKPSSTPVPEAEMEISPTLGRWQQQQRKNSELLVVMDLGANVVEVSGLRFAVDLCRCVGVGVADSEAGAGSGSGVGGGKGERGVGVEGVRFLML